MDTYLSSFLFLFFLLRNSKNVHPSHVMADRRCRTLDVGRQTSDVEAIQKHGGAIGFPLAMVLFFKFQLICVQEWEGGNRRCKVDRGFGSLFD